MQPLLENLVPLKERWTVHGLSMIVILETSTVFGCAAF